MTSVMSLIWEPHRGQTKGSTSYTFAISRAHAERQAACDTVVGLVAKGIEPVVCINHFHTEADPELSKLGTCRVKGLF